MIPAALMTKRHPIAEVIRVIMQISRPADLAARRYRLIADYSTAVLETRDRAVRAFDELMLHEIEIHFMDVFA